MTPFAQLVTAVLSLGTLFLGILTAAGFIGLLFFRTIPGVRNIFAKLSEYGLLLGFLVSLGALAGSLIYSNIIGFAPCDLCWWIRVLLYPQVLIFALGLYRKMNGKDTSHVFSESLAFSVIGALVSLYTYYGQSFNNGILTCNSAAVSCSKIYFTSLGFITIPMMALITFLALILIALIVRSRNKILS